MNDYLSKPVQPRQLAEMIEIWVAAGQVSRIDPKIDLAPSRRVSFDKSILLNRIDNDRIVFREIPQIFLTDAQPLLASLKEALCAEDRLKMQRHVHTLKGAAGSAGAMNMQALAAAIERSAQADDWEGSARLTDQLEAEFVEVKKEMDDACSVCLSSKKRNLIP